MKSSLLDWAKNNGGGITNFALDNGYDEGYLYHALTGKQKMGVKMYFTLPIEMREQCTFEGVQFSTQLQVLIDKDRQRRIQEQCNKVGNGKDPYKAIKDIQEILNGKYDGYLEM